jgi:hypothetical protein
LEGALSKKKVAPAKVATSKSEQPKPEGTKERNPASFIISCIPREILTVDALGAFIDEGLTWRVEMLSGLASNPRLKPTRVSSGQLEILDNVILAQTDTLGSLALASSIVQGRVHAWREDYRAGVEKTERFGKALIKSVRMHQHLEVAAIDPTMKEMKEAFVKELDIVLRHIRQAVEASRVSATHSELQQLFEEAVGGLEESYLTQNLDSWKAFIAARKLEFLENLNKPASMFDEWLAQWTTRKVEALRQKISEL